MEKHGTGEGAKWERRVPYLEDPMFFRVRSEIDSDGDWALYEYTSPPTRPDSAYTSKEVRPIGHAEAITNETGLVTGWKGTAIVTEYSFERHEPEDDFEFMPYEPRTTYTYELTDGGEVKPLSREYFAVFVRGGEFIKIYERAATPDAAYGADGNKRHATACEWNKTRAGYKKWELGNDGTMTFFDNDTYEVNGVRMRIQESYSTTPDHPAVIPYETVTTRTFYNSRNRVVREEHWIALENDGRELLDWKEYERNYNGKVVKETSSSGKTLEQKWVRSKLLETKDGDGNVTRYGYDAIDRLVKFENATTEENMRYDLASQMTNLYGSVYGRIHDISFKYDNAGELVDAGSDEGEKSKTVTDKDGSVKTYSNGRLISTVVENGEYEHTTFYGPKGKDSPRWHKTEWNPNGDFYVETSPRFGGGVSVITNVVKKAAATRDIAQKQRERYAKRRGLWWREKSDEKGNRVLSRITGLGDGSSETIYIDKEGRERKVLKLVDRNKGVSFYSVTRPESTLPEITIKKNGETVEHVSFSGITNRYERGVQERLVAIYDGRGAATRWTYDGRGRRASVTDRCGVTTRYAYDAKGRVVREDTDDGKEPRLTEYDDLGRIVSMRRGAKSVEVKYNDYDEDVSMSLTDGCDKYVVTNNYDEATGLLASRTINGVETKYCYDESGELTHVDGTDIRALRVAFTNGLELTKDKFGRNVSYSVAGKPKLTRVFDKETGRVSAVSVEGLGEAKYHYLSGTDLVETIEYPNGVVSTMEYDAEERMTRIEYSGLKEGAQSYDRKECDEIAERVMSLDGGTRELQRKPLSEDSRIYLDFTGAFERPFAEFGDDGKVRWCVLDVEGKARGVME